MHAVYYMVIPCSESGMLSLVAAIPSVSIQEGPVFNLQPVRLITPCSIVPHVFSWVPSIL